MEAGYSGPVTLTCDDPPQPPIPVAAYGARDRSDVCGQPERKLASLERSLSADGHSSSSESTSSNRLLSSGEKLRRKRKLHSCLNELKHYLISTNRDNSTDASSFSSSSSSSSSESSSAGPNVAMSINGQHDHQHKRMSGVNAVRRALKLLKRHHHRVTEEDEAEVTTVPKREIGEEAAMAKKGASRMDATDICPYSTNLAAAASRCWPSAESALATAGDKCDDTVLEHEHSIRLEVSCPDGVVVKASANTSDLLHSSGGSVIGERFVDMFNPGDQAFLVAFMLKANLLASPNHPSPSPPSDTDQPTAARRMRTGFYGSLRKGHPVQATDQNQQYVHCRLVCEVITEQPARIAVAALPLTVLVGPDYPEPSTLLAFYTKHTPSCIFTHVDPECVKSWGYLPRELVGRSLLSFVSKESLKWLEAAHEQAVKAKGKPVRSKLYSFLLRDGKVATMKTEWSLFVNPWTRTTEFVIGYHKVIDRSKDARFYDGEDAESGALTATKLEGRAAKAQSRIRRTLAKVKHHRHPKSHATISKKPVTACSSTTDKENGSTLASGHTQNGSGGDHGSNAHSSSSSSKPPKLNMGVFLDRMIESELFRNAELRNGSEMLSLPMMDNCKVLVHTITDHHQHLIDTRVIHHHQTSPISTGENISSSPPESNGSGPTYKEINLKEKVARYLNSQAAGQSSSSPQDSSNSGKSHISGGCSPPSYEHHLHLQQELHREIHVEIRRDATAAADDKAAAVGGGARPPDPSMCAIDLSTVVAASIMHRSQSAAADLTQYRHLTAALEGDVWNRQPIPLTPEILRQFTKEKERESKADWKRRFSTIEAPSPSLVQSLQFPRAPLDKQLQSVSPGKRASFDQEPPLDASPHKLPRPSAVDPQLYLQRENRPSSMPVISRLIATSANTAEVIKTPTNSTPWTTCPPPLPPRNTVDYYRSLGPTPAPPPGKNFQISSAPLPSAPMDPFSNTIADKSFPYAPGPYPPPPQQHQSAFAAPLPKPGFGSGQIVDQHRSVIQISPTSPFAAPPPPSTGHHWLNMPGTSASAILQRMVPKALAREQAEAAAASSTTGATAGGFWPPPTPMAPPPSSDPTPPSAADFARGHIGHSQSTAPAVPPQQFHQFNYPPPQHQSQPPTIMTSSYPMENMYECSTVDSDGQIQKPNDEISPIRESLMLLEEN